MYEVTSLEEFAMLVTEEQHVFYFMADWCGDCRYIESDLEEIAARYPEYPFIRVDFDGFKGIADKWEVIGIPSFVVIRKGKEIGRFVSKKRKTKAEIETFLDEVTNIN